MSDYSRDVSDAKTAFQDWGWHEGNILASSDADTIRDLLQRFGDVRSTFLEAMADLLELREDNLLERWQRLSDNGLELVMKLDDDIGRAGRNSDARYDGMSALGLGDFAEGEKRIWQECRRSTAASAADKIFLIERSNSELINKSKEDLMNALQRGNVVSQLAASYGYTYVDGLRDVAGAAISLVGIPIKAAVAVLGSVLAIAVKKTSKMGLEAALNANEAAKEKRFYKQIILDNRKMLDELKSTIDGNAIRFNLDEGVSFVRSLRSVGSTGAYSGADWEKFGAECDSKLQTRAQPALERADNLFSEVYPAMMQGLADVFSTLLSSIDNLEKFKGQLSAANISVYEALEKDEKVLEAIQSPENRAEAKATLDELRREVEETIQGLYDALKDAESND